MSANGILCQVERDVPIKRDKEALVAIRLPACLAAFSYHSTSMT